MPNSSSLNKQTTDSSDAPGCEESLVHLDNVWQVQRKVLATEKAQQMAEFFSVLSDPHRLKLLSALAQQELCVCDLAAIVKMGESAVSHQLRVLRSPKAALRDRKSWSNIAVKVVTFTTVLQMSIL